MIRKFAKWVSPNRSVELELAIYILLAVAILSSLLISSGIIFSKVF